MHALHVKRFVANGETRYAVVTANESKMPHRWNAYDKPLDDTDCQTYTTMELWATMSKHPFHKFINRESDVLSIALKHAGAVATNTQIRLDGQRILGQLVFLHDGSFLVLLAEPQQSRLLKEAIKSQFGI